MILVTGASGKTGRAVMRALAKRNQPLRALVHKPEYRQAMAAAGASDICIGDLRNKADLERACRSMRAIYAILPNMCADEAQIGENLLKAARSAGVAHFVYHSVLHPQVEAMPHHWQKMRLEALLFESGLEYTILQPAVYMQNILGYWQKIVEQGVYAVPYRVDTRLGMVDLEDVAQAAAVVLTEAGHTGATYELATDERLSQVEVAQTLARVLGKPVHAEETPRQMWEATVRAAGMDEYSITTLLKMFRYYESFGFFGNATILRGLIDCPPATFEAFIRRIDKE